MANILSLFRIFIFLAPICYSKLSEKRVTEDGFDIGWESSRLLEDSTVQVPDKDWIETALQDIAYYLRNHKYNEWDRRYYQGKPENNLLGFHAIFPMPPLRALHWKVSENCNKNFYKCITYLHDVVKTSPFTRDDDVVTLVNRREVLMNETFVKQLHSECRYALLHSEKTGAPFDSPTEKFQWRTTASYYMCWYTMLEQPELSMLGEPCDNHANCLDPEFGTHDRDPRSDDRIFFACATYSFCPDICCPIKHLKSFNECHDTEINPCFVENYKRNPAERVCSMNRRGNQNFYDIVKNRWNVTCSCENIGFIWKSEYSLCVDINECVTGTHTCDEQTEDCFNLPGNFMCICKWGFRYSNKEKHCRKHNIF